MAAGTKFTGNAGEGWCSEVRNLFYNDFIMTGRELQRIRNAILDCRYTLTEHACDEMEDDNLDVLDVESAILTGQVDKVLSMDSRGTRYVVTGRATDQETLVGVVVRFVEHDQLLIITVYEIK